MKIVFSLLSLLSVFLIEVQTSQAENSAFSYQQEVLISEAVEQFASAMGLSTIDPAGICPNLKSSLDERLKELEDLTEIAATLDTETYFNSKSARDLLDLNQAWKFVEGNCQNFWL